tara:strand:- start:204 stop:386 length:183 start_codon:yes stop_codon:yes gene_type:complete
LKDILHLEEQDLVVVEQVLLLILQLLTLQFIVGILVELDQIFQVILLDQQHQVMVKHQVL